MDWQQIKKIKKDKIYYFKYQKLWRVFMITDSPIFDNSMQINYEFIYVVYEYIPHLIFFQSHFLIIITSGNSLPTCEHTPSQQSRNQRNQSNFV